MRFIRGDYDAIKGRLAYPGRWPKDLAAFLYPMWIVNEVENGGPLQLLANPSGQHLQQMQDALEQVDSKKGLAFMDAVATAFQPYAEEAIQAVAAKPDEHPFISFLDYFEARGIDVDDIFGEAETIFFDQGGKEEMLSRAVRYVKQHPTLLFRV